MATCYHCYGTENNGYSICMEIGRFQEAQVKFPRKQCWLKSFAISQKLAHASIFREFVQKIKNVWEIGNSLCLCKGI